MYAPHTVTLYNLIEDDDGNVSYNITIIKGVMLQPILANSSQKNGAVSADSVKLFIPNTAKAYDAISFDVKPFTQEAAYNSLTDKKSAWTIKNGGETSNVECWFVKGENITNSGYKYCRENFDFCFDVTSYIVFDYGSKRMQHIEVLGK